MTVKLGGSSTGIRRRKNYRCEPIGSPDVESGSRIGNDGIKHKPETTFGNVKADVMADKDPKFQCTNAAVSSTLRSGGAKKCILEPAGTLHASDDCG
jgi:hypothetical protein